MTDTLMKYDELVQRHDAAYAAFKSIYVSKNPAPALEKTGTDWVSVLILGVLVVASITVSGSRTIDEFGGGVVGVAAFVMLEIALIAYAYWRTKKSDDVGQHQAVRKRANAGMWLAFGVSLAANLHATLKHAGIVMPAALDTGILVMLAISAPSLALIAGDMLGMEAVAGLALQRQARAAYAEALRLWTEGLNKSWDSQKSRWGVKIEVEAFASNAIPAPSNGIPLEAGRAVIPSASTLGHSKKPNARQITEQYFDENPDALQHNPLEIAARLGVGKSTVYAVRAERTEGDHA